MQNRRIEVWKKVRGVFVVRRSERHRHLWPPQLRSNLGEK